MVSRKEVALRAGVSQATVTNVFNRSKNVSIDIRKKVLDAANEIGYQNPQPTEFVLIVNDASNPHHGIILRGMKETAEKHGAFASMILLDNDADELCMRLVERRVSGVFLSTTENEFNETHCQMLEKAGIGFSSSWKDFDMDFDLIYRNLVEYLAGHGHHNIAFLSGIDPDEHRNVRLASFHKAMEFCGLSYDRTLTIEGTYPYKTDSASGYWAMKSLLNRRTDFTAVVALNDLMAFGAMRALNEAELSVPEDVSVVGCDNIPFAEYSSPPLTTLNIPAREMGRQIIFNLMQKSKHIEAAKIRLHPELLIRNSTGKARFAL